MWRFTRIIFRRKPDEQTQSQTRPEPYQTSGTSPPTNGHTVPSPSAPFSVSPVRPPIFFPKLLRPSDTPSRTMNPGDDHASLRQLEPLLHIRAMFPFDFFPNEVIIRPLKVDIIYKSFFASRHVHSILLRDIADVTMDTSLGFAKLSLYDRRFLLPVPSPTTVVNPLTIEYLKKSDALRARRIVFGLIVLRDQERELGKYKTAELRNIVEQLGYATLEA